MSFDKLTKCTRCESDACYSQEVTDGVTIQLCYGCGFQSNTIMVSGSDMFNEQMQTLPDLYKALMDEEEDGKLWMPSFTNVEDKGMVFADGTDRENWAWGAAKAVEVTEDEKEKYKGAKYRVDMSTVKHFKERDFMDALSYIEVIP